MMPGRLLPATGYTSSLSWSEPAAVATEGQVERQKLIQVAAKGRVERQNFNQVAALDKLLVYKSITNAGKKCYIGLSPKGEPLASQVRFPLILFNFYILEPFPPTNG